MSQVRLLTRDLIAMQQFCTVCIAYLCNRAFQRPGLGAALDID